MRVYVDSLRRDGVNKRAIARTWAVVSDVAVVHARPRTTSVCGASGRNVSVVRRQERRNDGTRHRQFKLNIFTSVSGVPLFWTNPRNFWRSTTTGLLALSVTNSHSNNVRTFGTLTLNPALRRNSSKNVLLLCCPGTVPPNLAVVCLLKCTRNTAVDYPIVKRRDAKHHPF